MVGLLSDAGADDAGREGAEARLWSRIWAPASGGGEGVVVDRQTNIYVCGNAWGDFDGATNTRAGTSDMFLTKWTSDGTWLWTRIWGSTNDDTSAGVVCDSACNAYVGGTTKGEFGTAGQTNHTAYNRLALSSYDTFGNPRWSRVWGASNRNNNAYGVCAPGSVYVTGSTQGSFDGQPDPCSVGSWDDITDLFITQFDDMGNTIWTRPIL